MDVLWVRVAITIAGIAAASWVLAECGAKPDFAFGVGVGVGAK